MIFFKISFIVLFKPKSAILKTEIKKPLQNQQVLKVIWQKGYIAATHGWFVM